MKKWSFCLFFIIAAAGVARSQTDDGNSAVLGVVIGAPSSIALVGGYDAGPVALRLSGGAWGKGWYGAQADVSVIFSRSGSFSQGLSVLAGQYGTKVVSLDDQLQEVTQFNKQKYLGIAYDAWFSGFFLQVGMGHGWGDFPNPNLLFQFGYLFQIR